MRKLVGCVVAFQGVSLSLLALSCSKNAQAQVAVPYAYFDNGSRYEFMSGTNFANFTKSEWPLSETESNYGTFMPDSMANAIPGYASGVTDVSVGGMKDGFYVINGNLISLQFGVHKYFASGPAAYQTRQPGCIFSGPYANQTTIGHISAKIVMSGSHMMPPKSENPWVNDQDFPMFRFQLVSNSGLLAEQWVSPATHLDGNNSAEPYVAIQKLGKPLELSLSFDSNKNEEGIILRICEVSVRSSLSILSASLVLTNKGTP
jgi:hypothetical protein